MKGHGEGPRSKNGPAPAGHGAEAVHDAIAAAITALPERLRRSAGPGPGRGDGPARRAADRHRPPNPRPRPPEPLAARDRRGRPAGRCASASRRARTSAFTDPAFTDPAHSRPSPSPSTAGPERPGLAHARPGAERAADDRSRRPRRVRPIETARHAREPCRGASDAARTTPSTSRREAVWTTLPWRRLHPLKSLPPRRRRGSGACTTASQPPEPGRAAGSARPGRALRPALTAFGVGPPLTGRVERVAARPRPPRRRGIAGRPPLSLGRFGRCAASGSWGPRRWRPRSAASAASAVPSGR